MFHQWLISLWRTVVPVIVGGGIGWLAGHGITIDGVSEAQIDLAVTVFGTGLYYGAFRALEQRFPILGVFLGSTRQPVYPQLGQAEDPYEGQ